MIRAAGIVKSFRDPRGETLRVLDGVDLAVEPGRVAALMGGNGAGKTTLLRILAALMRPDAGTVRVGGACAASDPGAVRARVGLLTEEAGLAAAATPLWQVSLHASLSGIARARAIEEAGRVLRALGLWPSRNLPMRLLSRGGRQKVALARVLVRSTPALLLDEPTSNLDAASAGWLRREVRRLAARGSSVVLVTHDSGEASAVCDEIHHLRSGRLRSPGSPAAGD